MNKFFDSIDGLIRTHNCAKLSIDNLGQEVVLCGWLNKNRSLEELHFLDLRDMYEITQLNITNYMAIDDELGQLSNKSVILAKERIVSRLNETQKRELNFEWLKKE